MASRVQRRRSHGLARSHQRRSNVPWGAPMRLSPTLSALALCVACAPTVPIGVSLDPCIESGVEVAIALETGPCEARASVTRVAGPGESLGSVSPGSYCIDALAYRRDDASHVCRLDGLHRENRRFPDDRHAVTLAVDCTLAAPDDTDDLLAQVAGCNGACDHDRCVCLGGCDIGDPSAACPAPVLVEHIVMGDHYACGLALDHRSFWCWGDDQMGEATDGTSGTAGTARTVFPMDAGANEYVVYDGGPAMLCTQAANGDARCGPHVTHAEGRLVRALDAVGEGFLCRGESAQIGCWGLAPGTAGVLPFAFPSALSAGRSMVCGLVAGTVYCATPLEGCPTGGCWWGEDDCAIDADPGVSECTALVPPIDPTRARAGFIDVDLGWDRGCAADTYGRLICWSEQGGDPIGLPVPRLVPGRPVALATPIQGFGGEDETAWAREVSVGVEHVCVRRHGVVECGVIEQVGEDFVFARRETFPGDGAIGDFAAGPHGISCAVRAVEGAPSRVECFQLAGFVGSEALLGRTHTRDLAAGLDPDRADQAVCP